MKNGQLRCSRGQSVEFRLNTERFIAPPGKRVSDDILGRRDSLIQALLKLSDSLAKSLVESA